MAGFITRTPYNENAAHRGTLRTGQGKLTYYLDSPLCFNTNRTEPLLTDTSLTLGQHTRINSKAKM